MKKSLRPAWLIVRSYLYFLAVVWLFALLVSTLIIHQPLAIIQQATSAPFFDDVSSGFSSASWPLNVGTSLALTLRDIASVILLISAAGGLGFRIIPHSSHLTEIESPLLQALIGLGLLSAMTLVAGLLGWLPSPTVGTLILVAACAAQFGSVRRWWRSLTIALDLVFMTPLPAFETWLRRAVVLFLALSFLMSLAPPTKWDALTYHLEVPAYYLQHGGIVSNLDNHFFGFPHGVEMLYLWLMVVARPQAAAQLHWALGVAMLLLTCGVARRINRPHTGILAMVILLVCDSLWYEFSWPYNDLGLMAYILAALVCLLAWRNSVDQMPRNGLRLANSSKLAATSPALFRLHCYLILAGVFVGLAMGVKYTAAAPAIGVGVATLWLARKKGLAFSMFSGGMVSICALAVFAPWLVKNTLLDGNPVSPFVFGTARFDSMDQYYYLRPGTGLDAVNAFFAPIIASVKGVEAGTPYGSSSGALVVSLLSMAFIVPTPGDSPEGGTLRAFTAFAIPAYLIWLAGAVESYYLEQARLLFPIFPALALMGAAGVDRLASKPKPVNIHLLSRVAVVIALLAAIISSAASFITSNTLPVTLGLSSEAHYLEESLGVYYVAMEQINTLPQDSKILFLWEPRTFYCRRDCIPDSLINQWWHDRKLEPDPHQIANRWREQGVTHVLIFEDGLTFLTTEEQFEPLSASDVAALDQLRQQDLHVIWNQYSSYSLYELRTSP